MSIASTTSHVAPSNNMFPTPVMHIISPAFTKKYCGSVFMRAVLYQFYLQFSTAETDLTHPQLKYRLSIGVISRTTVQLLRNIVRIPIECMKGPFQRFSFRATKPLEKTTRSTKIFWDKNIHRFCSLFQTSPILNKKIDPQLV